MTTDFEERRLNRIERLHNAADRAKSQAELSLDQAHQMAGCIPFGQPILVGHYSEKRDRNYRAKIESKFDNGFNLLKKSEYLEERARAAEKNDAIFSDDPAAVEKLEDKITRLEERQARMIAANKLVRKNDREGLLNMGFSEHIADELLKPDCCGRYGFADYATKNNNANIRRLKLRVQVLEKKQAQTTCEKEVNGIRIVDNVEENRLQLFFFAAHPTISRNAA